MGQSRCDGGRKVMQLMGGHRAEVMIDEGLDAESIGVGM